MSAENKTPPPNPEPSPRPSPVGRERGAPADPPATPVLYVAKQLKGLAGLLRKHRAGDVGRMEAAAKWEAFIDRAIAEREGRPEGDL